MTDRPIINIDKLSYFDFGDGGKFEAKLGRISPSIGAKKLGYNLTVVPPGKCAFPRHTHHANEEMFFVIEGEGILRRGDSEYPVRQGDVIACPAGTGAAHQISNTGEADMKYLAVSTTISPEVCEYPDSNKVAALSGDFEKSDLALIVNKDSAVGYFDGEGDS